MDLRDLIESDCWGRSCMLIPIIGWYCIPNYMSNNCCIAIGYDLHCTSNDGLLLRNACSCNDYHKVKELCDTWKHHNTRLCCFVNPLIEGGENERFNSLHISSLNGNVEILNELLKSSKIDVNQYTFFPYPISTTHITGKPQCRLKFKKIFNTTAVHLAVSNGYHEVLDLLIKHGADLMQTINERDNLHILVGSSSSSSITTAQIIQKSTKEDIAKQYINDMTINYQRSQYVYARSNNITTIDDATTNNNPLHRKNLNKAKIRPVDYNLCLHILERNGLEFDIMYIIEQAYQYEKIDLLEYVYKKDPIKINSMFLLHRAIKDNKKEVMMKSIIKYGADVNLLDSEKHLPAYYAVQPVLNHSNQLAAANGNILKLLISEGFDIHQYGSMILEEAIQMKCIHGIELLQQAINVNKVSSTDKLDPSQSFHFPLAILPTTNHKQPITATMNKPLQNPNPSE